MHKVILAGASDYFKCLFNSDMKENNQSKVSFNFSQNGMESLIQYIYSGEVCIDEKNVEELTEISSYLQVFNLYNNWSILFN